MTSHSLPLQAAPRSLREAFAHGPLRWAALFTALFAGASLLPHWKMFSALEDYLALHTTLEFFSIAVSAMVFALGWNLPRAGGERGPE